MTIKDSIGAIDLLKPNAYTEGQKVAWLSELDTSIYWQLVRKVNPNDDYDPDKTYNTGDTVDFGETPYVCQADGVSESPEDAPDSWAAETWAGYDSTDNAFDEDTILLAPVPYDIPLYTNWLALKISLFNREIQHYNNESLLFNVAWGNLANHLVRSFRPVAKATHFQL